MAKLEKIHAHLIGEFLDKHTIGKRIEFCTENNEYCVENWNERGVERSFDPDFGK